MKKKSLTVNALLNGVRTALNFVFPLVTFPYVSRVLSVGGVGQYNFANTFVSYFILIAGLGISTYAVKEGAKIRDDRRAVGEFASQVFSINMIATVIAYVILIPLVLLVPSLHAYQPAIFVFSIQILFTTLGTEWIFAMYEEYLYIAIRSIIFKLASIGLLFFFVRQEDDVLVYAFITVFATVGSNLLNFFRSRRFIRIRFTLKIDWRVHVRPIALLFVAALAVQVYANSSTTILGMLRGAYDVGLYAVSLKIYTIAKSVIAAILVVALPRLSMYWGRGLFEQYRTLLNTIGSGLFTLIVPMMIGMFFFAKQVIEVLSGVKYLGAVSSFRILLFALLISAITWMFNDCVLIVASQERFIVYSTVLSALANVAFCLVFIGRWGQVAAAMSVLVAESVGMLLNILFSRKIVPLSSIFRIRPGIIVGWVFLAIEAYFISSIVLINSFGTLLLGIGVLGLTYGVMLIVVRDPIFMSICSKVRTSLGGKLMRNNLS